MLATKSRSFTENLDKAISDFKNENKKIPDYVIIHYQLYHDYLKTLTEEERIAKRSAGPARYANTVLIQTGDVATNEIIPVMATRAKES